MGGGISGLGGAISGSAAVGAAGELEEEILVDSGIGGEESPYGTPPVLLTPGYGAGVGFTSPKERLSPPKTTLTSSVNSLKALLGSPKMTRENLGVFSVTRNTNV